MRINFKYFFLFLPLLVATANRHSICGKYEVNNNEWYWKTLAVHCNGHFTETMSGCVYETRTTGRWKVQNDTLILQVNRRRDLRSGHESKVDNKTNKYLIKSDTLFQIYGDETNTILDKEFSLIRRNKK